MNTEFKTKRMTILIEPSRYELIKAIAGENEFIVNGEPSTAAVVRAALDLFFAQRVHFSGDFAVKVNEAAA